MKAKLLSFVFISFSESGLFNELRPIQIKKSLSSPFASRVVGAGAGRWVMGAFLIRNHHSADFCSWQEKVMNSGITRSPGGPALDRPAFRKNQQSEAARTGRAASRNYWLFMSA
jgi:hypothetical protein